MYIAEMIKRLQISALSFTQFRPQRRKINRHEKKDKDKRSGSMQTCLDPRKKFLEQMLRHGKSTGQTWELGM